MYDKKAVKFYEKGRSFHQSGRLSEAERAYKKAIKINSDFVEAHNNLGNVLLDRGRIKEASTAFRRALELLPDQPMLLANIGNVLQLQGKNREAVGWLRKAIAKDPDYAPAYSNLGNALKEMDSLTEAVDCYRCALKIDPCLAETYTNLGSTLKELGELEAAVEHHDRAIQLKPDFTRAYYHRGNVLGEIGLLARAIASHEQAIQLKHDFVEAYSNRNFLLNYSSDLTLPEIYSKHLEFERQFGGIRPVTRKRLSSDRGRGVRLRVGYLSPDFNVHSVAYFFEPLLRAHDRSTVEVYCYYNNTRNDETTRHLMQEAEHWRSIADMNDKDVVDLIIKDNIDILVDLAGHTAKNRLTVFAHKPAPLQITWLGYPNTTGLSAMDYRFTDHIADPAGVADKLHSEKLVRLSKGFLCYQGDKSAPRDSRPPFMEKGYITFGSFNNLSKVTEQVVKLWARILRSVPDAHLLLKSKQFSDSRTKARFLEMFLQEGISQNRLEFYARQPKKEDHLALYNKVDIGLDPFPYNGTTTTCEALWMGVPVITLSGDRHAGRVGASIMTHLGLEGFTATDEGEYLNMAVRYAGDTNYLADLRAGLREQMRESDLCNTDAFARSIELAYQQIWDEYLLDRPQTH